MRSFDNLAAEAILNNQNQSIPFDGLITTSSKVAADQERLAAYLAGEAIYPLSVEFDLTDQCNRVCPGCPSVKATNKNFLSLEFIDRIMGILEGQAKGLLLTGGEPTIAPLFADALAIAKTRQFEQISVVSNGKCLNNSKVIDALLSQVTSLRVSLYDWEEGLAGPLKDTLANLAALRNQVERSGSELSIGVSVLTNLARKPDLGRIIQTMADSGVHWVYFHPMCDDWGTGRPVVMDQSGVLEELTKLRELYKDIIPVFMGAERYSKSVLEFSQYHAAHFLLVIGADGKNYLSPETKYNPQYVLADLGPKPREDFLWSAARKEAIAIPSHLYGGIGSRHRSALYSSRIEDIIKGRESLAALCADADKFIHRYIL